MDDDLPLPAADDDLVADVGMIHQDPDPEMPLEQLLDLETWQAQQRDDAEREERRSAAGEDDGNAPPRGWNADQRLAWNRFRDHERYQREVHESVFGPDAVGSPNSSNGEDATNDSNVDAAATTTGMSAANGDRTETLRQFESRQFAFHARAVPVQEEDAGDENRHLDDVNRLVASSTTTTAARAAGSTTTVLSTSPIDDSTVAVSFPLRPVAERCEMVFAAASRHNCHHMALVSDGATGELYPETAIRHFLRLLLNESSVEDTPDGDAVDCCRLAHFFRKSKWVDEYAAILANSVDPENCLPMLQLAEQLQLPSLWEKSLQQVLNTMDRGVELGGDSSNGSSASDCFMTKELRDRIDAIRSVVRSSVHGPCTGSRTSRLFFSSVEEYVSIFAERVEYFRERLSDAKAQRDELLRGGRGGSGGADYNNVPFYFDQYYGGLSQQYKNDLQAKIERQEQRVQTLEISLKEHKKLLVGFRRGRGDYDSVFDDEEQGSLAPAHE